MSVTGERPTTGHEPGRTSLPSAPMAPRRQGKAVHRRGRGAGTAAPVVANASHRTERVAGPRARLRYWFDTGLSRGPSVVIGWLGLLTLGVIVVTAIVMTLFGLVGVNGGERLPFGEAVWQSMLRVVDAGTFAGDASWPTRFLGLGITLAGIFLAGSLIGLIANVVDQRVEQLRKGRSAVLESGHTLILGWSSRVPTIVSELVLANESERRGVVVILADEDKSEMEDRLRDHVDDFLTTRLVCRHGRTDLPADLDLVNLRHAKSVVVVGDEDATVVKTLLAVRSIDPGFEQAHVVVEVGSTST
ncbi:MAG: potassium channel family protein, partial [Microthrixaceae bacterium]